MDVFFERLFDYGGIGLLAVGLALGVVFLWREVERAKRDGDKRYNDLSLKYDQLQAKYEQVLIDMGKLTGKVDAEINIDQKLEKILQIINHD